MQSNWRIATINNPGKNGKVLSIIEAKNHSRFRIGQSVHGRDPQAMLNAELDVLRGAQCYERSADRVDRQLRTPISHYSNRRPNILRSAAVCQPTAKH
jgi:hypothetical protein